MFSRSSAAASVQRPSSPLEHALHASVHLTFFDELAPLGLLQPLTHSERVLATLPVSDDLRFALSSKAGRFSDVYNMVLSYEHGDWKQLSATLAARIDNADTLLPGCYLMAAQRASQIAA